MIDIYRGTLKSEGACNFCSEGELTKNGQGLKYPYRTVFVISGNTLKFCICSKCLAIIKKAK